MTNELTSQLTSILLSWTKIRKKITSKIQKRKLPLYKKLIKSHSAAAKNIDQQTAILF